MLSQRRKKSNSWTTGVKCNFNYYFKDSNKVNKRSPRSSSCIRNRQSKGLLKHFSIKYLGFPCGSAGKESACNEGDLGLIPVWEDPLEKGKATHASILAWRIPWTVWSMGLQRVGHDWATCTFRKHIYHYLKILKADYFDNCIVSGWSSLWFYLFLFCEVWKNTEQGFKGFTRESKVFMAYERPRAPELNLICGRLPYSRLH